MSSYIYTYTTPHCLSHDCLQHAYENTQPPLLPILLAPGRLATLAPSYGVQPSLQPLPPPPPPTSLASRGSHRRRTSRGYQHHLDVRRVPAVRESARSTVTAIFLFPVLTEFAEDAANTVLVVAAAAAKPAEAVVLARLVLWNLTPALGVTHC